MLESPPDSHAFSFLNPRKRDGLNVFSRRSVLKAGLTGLAGLTFPDLIRIRSEAAKAGASLPGRKSVILIWMTGGPSHIDTWDMKPDRPSVNRGPFSPISTKLPGVQICEYLPKQAAMMDKFTLIRSVDCQFSNHEPNMVMQTAHREAAPRINPRGHLYPSIGSLAAHFNPAKDPSVPPYVALNMKSRSHIATGGYIGKQYDPFVAKDVGKLFHLPRGLTMSRVQSRRSLLKQMDHLRSNLDTQGEMEAMNHFEQQAYDMVAGGRAQSAFDLTKESPKIIERYGDHEWWQQALLARRLVESGVGFVTIDLSNHGASGTWDNHGDNIPPYGGIWNGLRPLLPVFDHLITTLVGDLEERGLLDDTLVIAMGEFGRTPMIGTQGSSDGRNHWPVVSSMLMAGGGFRHGQVIGATTKDGGEIAERPVTPGDIAATIYHHFGISLESTYQDHQGRPHYIVQEGGKPISEIV
ncbi:MAG: DUF1501 domain-containing protein [Verrucomicrobia bacterium]|jgi:hypothetical protein|nr:DUF1501 domain-containing protein [Verrucomicrobiota bacterium]MDA7667427.1 DUF1501 domain-containing protein [bacterium]